MKTNIIGIYGETGQRWLDGLAEQIQELEKLWGLTDLTPYDNLSYNYVLSGLQEDKSIVLKLSLDVAGLEREAQALKAFAGYGAVSLLDQLPHALLLQRALPGKCLKGNPEALQIACRVIEDLHKAPPPPQGCFPHIKEWLAALDNEWEIPKELLIKARKLKNQLLENPGSQVLLHGDLHQENILSNGKEWLVIDPKGVIGYPINEIWACVEDPSFDLDHISNYFHFPRDEVVKWYYVHLVLAATWQVEDNLDPTLFLNLAESCSP